MLRIFVGGGRSASFEMSLNLADSFIRKQFNELIVCAYNLNLRDTGVNETEDVSAITKPVLFSIEFIS